MSINRSFVPSEIRSSLDVIEKVVLIVLLGFLAARMIPPVFASATYANILLLLSETIAVLFVICRRATPAISHRPLDWFLGFAGTFVVLLAIPASGSPVIPAPYCLSLMLLGFGLQFAAKLTLRRSFGVVAANRGVKAGGPYGLVRHPMYAGYVLTHLGFLLAGPNLWNAIVYAVAASLFIARIVAEERLLTDDPAYQALCAKVRYRLVPFVY
jgi:protein-S-isoprenylcysteine O-methyltransferase Ste14